MEALIVPLPFRPSTLIHLFVFGKKNLSLLPILYFLEFNMKVGIVLVMASKRINHLSNNNSKNGLQIV